ncbi:hypothetical protein HKD37_17G048167 [Glycine soja]
MHSEAKALEHMKKTDTGHQSVSLENKTGDSTVLKIGDSAKVVIKQDMKGGEHKYGFNNNKREKPEKVRLVDDETGDKHDLYDCSYIELYKYWVSGIYEKHKRSIVGLLGKVFSFRIVSTPHGEPNNVAETVVKKENKHSSWLIMMEACLWSFYGGWIFELQ